MTNKQKEFLIQSFSPEAPFFCQECVQLLCSAKGGRKGQKKEKSSVVQGSSLVGRYPSEKARGTVHAHPL